VSFADPLVKEQALAYVPRLNEEIEWNKESLSEFNAIIIVIKQVKLDFDVLKELQGVLVEKYCQYLSSYFPSVLFFNYSFHVGGFG
jgi:hypothetical protein